MTARVPRITDVDAATAALREGCESIGWKFDDAFGDQSRRREFVRARAEAIRHAWAWRSADGKGLTLVAIARATKKDHTTIMYLLANPPPAALPDPHYAALAALDKHDIPPEVFARPFVAARQPSPGGSKSGQLCDHGDTPTRKSRQPRTRRTIPPLSVPCKELDDTRPLELPSLDTPEKREVWRRYGEKGTLTLEEIGVLFDMTRERVRQIEEKALGKMKVLLGFDMEVMADCLGDVKRW